MDHTPSSSPLEARGRGRAEASGGLAGCSATPNGPATEARPDEEGVAGSESGMDVVARLEKYQWMG